MRQGLLRRFNRGTWSLLGSGVCLWLPPKAQGLCYHPMRINTYTNILTHAHTNTDPPTQTHTHAHNTHTHTYTHTRTHAHIHLNTEWDVISESPIETRASEALRGRRRIEWVPNCFSLWINWCTVTYAVFKKLHIGLCLLNVDKLDIFCQNSNAHNCEVCWWKLM